MSEREEYLEFSKRQHDAVLDVLIAANMWTGDPPYRGKTAAQQVQMLVQRAEAAESALVLATGSTPGKTTGVWMTLPAYMDLLAQIAELEERVKTLQVRQSTAAQDQGEQQ